MSCRWSWGTGCKHHGLSGAGDAFAHGADCPLSGRPLPAEEQGEGPDDSAVAPIGGEAAGGSGDRSEKIRTYNYPQNRVTDHRIELTLYNLDRFMEGEIQEMIDSLVQADLHDRLAAANIA